MFEHDPLPVSFFYQPEAPNYVSYKPLTDQFERWGYALGFELDEGDLPVPEDGNTALFAIAPQGMTEPQYVSKSEDDATFTVTVIGGSGLLIRQTAEGVLDQVPLEPDSQAIIHPGDMYSYKNMSLKYDLILRDIARPAFQEGDEIELTSSLLDGPRPEQHDDRSTCIAIDSEGYYRTIEQSNAFTEALSLAMRANKLITLETKRPGLKLRTLATEYDDKAYLEGVNEDRSHLSQHGDTTAENYNSTADAKRARENAGDKLRFGIWDGDRFVGSINAEPYNDGKSVEIGYWLRKSAEGHGYMSDAVTTLIDYLKHTYNTITAQVHVENSGSTRVLQKAGLMALGASIESWGTAIDFEYRPSPSLHSFS